VLVVGVLAPGGAIVGALAPGVVPVGVAGALAVGVVVTVVVAGVVEPEPPASLTSAAASTPSAIAATTASTAIGVFQLGVAARRVRAAAPQAMHQSCSACSAAPHSGHVSLAGVRGGAAAPDGLAAPASAGGEPLAAAGQPVPLGFVAAAETVTSRLPVGG
jgi:hypothetical protein